MALGYWTPFRPPFFQYDATSTQGQAGGGGEYEVQTGFGWSNGVVIEFMNLFGDELLADDGVDGKFVAGADKEEEEEMSAAGAADGGGDLVQLCTHFDVSKGKSKLIDSRVSQVSWKTCWREEGRKGGREEGRSNKKNKMG